MLKALRVSVNHAMENGTVQKKGTHADACNHLDVSGQLQAPTIYPRRQNAVPV
jgi:hypothetical protein